MGQIQAGYDGPEIVGTGLIAYLDANIPYVTRSAGNIYGNTWIDLLQTGNSGSLSCALNGNQFNAENCTDYPSFVTTNNISYWDFTSNGVGNGRNIKFPQLVPTSSSFTIEIWIRRNSSNTADKESLFTNANGANGYRFGIATSGVLYYLISANDATGYSEGNVGSGYNVRNDTWTQCVMVYDRFAELSATRQVIAYVNGTQRGSVNISAGLVGTGDGLPGISRWCCDSYRGLVARLLIYNRALGANEILQNYNAAKTIFISGFPGSVVTDQLRLSLDAGDTRSYQGTGSIWSDTSGNINNGTLTNDPTYSGDNFGSIVFDGSNDYVALPASNTIVGNNPTEISLEAWVKYTSTANMRMINLCRDTSDVNSLCFLVANSTVGALSVGRWTGTAVQNVTATGSYNDGAWKHIVGTMSTTAGTNLYINGQLIITSSVSFATVSGNTSIGRVGSALNNANYWNGNIAIARIYTKVLNATEVRQNYNETRARFGL